MAVDMAQEDEPEAAKLSSGTVVLWENAVKSLLSVTAVLEGTEWPFSAFVVTGQLEESGAEVISMILLYTVLRVTGTDMHLSGKQRLY